MSAGDVTRGSLTAEQVAEYTDALTRHYGERVAPVSDYCKAFEVWGQALVDRKARIEALPDDDPVKKYELDNPLTRLADQVPLISLAIRKSNLLWRLVYGGQPIRTEMCPEHQGRWSGCQWDQFCECQDGSDVTGWLPKHRLSTAEVISRFAKACGGMARWATHSPASPDYDAEQPTTASALGKHARGATVDQAAERLAVELGSLGFVADEWQPGGGES